MFKPIREAFARILTPAEEASARRRIVRQFRKEHPLFASNYMPHQGKREMARRARALQKEAGRG